MGCRLPIIGTTLEISVLEMLKLKNRTPKNLTNPADKPRKTKGKGGKCRPKKTMKKEKSSQRNPMLKAYILESAMGPTRKYLSKREMMAIMK
jgi:hypothetical protein